MPQASQALRDEFYALFGEDGEAWDAIEYLRTLGYKERGGWISPPPGRVPSRKEDVAIDYLCEEWDYAYKELP